LDGFILKRRFYWSNAHRALYGLAPMPIDAQGYDLAIVDTPHFLKVVGIAPERIFSVVHDLIPLRDPTTGTNARQLFMQKLRATLALRSTLIFVSEYTQATFHKSFPGHKRNKEIILYPAIRASLLSESNVQGPSSPVGSVPSGGQAREDRLDMLSLQASDKSNKGKVGKKKRKDETPPSQQLDLSLPYFATAISDEPRKNIAILVKACKFLSGRANIVVVGMVDGNRYIKAEARKPDNIVFTGYAAESVKVAVFRGATGVVFPSFAEGFGIPVVEGAVMGVPVLCSDIPVFREVAGDNAIYFDPYDPKSLAAAIERILGDPGAARQKAELLRESVLERFSQDAMSRRLAAALADVGLAVPRSERDAPTALPSR
jgi:glycosyltransferase involved in cell wall biosynthesis